MTCTSKLGAPGAETRLYAGRLQKDRRVLLLVIASAALSLNACTSKRDRDSTITRERDLAETLAWMCQTYNNGHGEVHRTLRYGGSVSKKTQTFEYQGCRVTSKSAETEIGGAKSRCS
jgi:hypothetical protein